MGGGIERQRFILGEVLAFQTNVKIIVVLCTMREFIEAIK